MLPGDVCIVDLFYRDLKYAATSSVALAFTDAGPELYSGHVCAVRSVGVRSQQDRAFDGSKLSPRLCKNLAYGTVHGTLSDLQEAAGYVYAPFLYSPQVLRRTRTQFS